MSILCFSSLVVDVRCAVVFVEQIPKVNCLISFFRRLESEPKSGSGKLTYTVGAKVSTREVRVFRVNFDISDTSSAAGGRARLRPCVQSVVVACMPVPVADVAYGQALVIF